MTKRELVIQVANKLGMTQSDVAKIIEGAFDTISRELAEGKRWELRDFGVFEVKTRASRMGRNPRTGDQVPVPARRVVTFRPGKHMKEMVSRGKKPDETPPPDTSPERKPADSPLSGPPSELRPQPPSGVPGNPSGPGDHGDGSSA